MRGKIADTGRADQIWKLLLQEGDYLFAVGNDDAHGPHENLNKDWAGTSHVGWTGVLVDEVSQKSIIQALRAGRTYASEGPEIHSIKFNPEGELIVECSACVACHFRSMGNYGGSSTFPETEKSKSQKFVFDLTYHGYRIQDYIIVILQDEWGRRAWTSPIPVNINYSQI